MLNAFTCRLLTGVSVLCATQLFVEDETVQARPVESLLPLQTRSIETPGQPVALDRVADDMNTQIAAEQARLNEPVGLQLKDIPLVRDLIDESGSFDMSGGSLPVSVGMGRVVGRTGVVLSTDF